MTYFIFSLALLFSLFPSSLPCIATVSPDGRPGIGLPGSPGIDPGSSITPATTTTLLVTTTTTTTTTTLNPCPTSAWIYNSANGYCYLVSTFAAFPFTGGWQTAENDCVAQGAHLTSILSQAENDFVVMISMSPGIINIIDLPWIGAMTVLVQALPPIFATTWSDGSPYPGSYTNYALPPTSGCGQLFYATVLNVPVLPGQWQNNAVCTFGARKYVCKRLP